MDIGLSQMKISENMEPDNYQEKIYFWINSKLLYLFVRQRFAYFVDI